MDVSASPVYNQVHQEQISAEQEKFERVQQHTVDQIVHVPIPQSQELNMEGVKDIPQERFLQQTVWQIENATPAPALDMFPHEQFDEACRILDLKQSSVRLTLGHNDLIFTLTYPLKKSTNPVRRWWNISNRNFVPSVPIDLQ